MSSATQQFYIPAHWDFDTVLFGDLKPHAGLSHPYGPMETFITVTDPKEPVFLFADFGVKLADVKAFLKDISPAFTTLAMAGYRVPSLSIVFPSYVLTGPADPIRDLRKWWLHIDMMRRTVRLDERPIGDDYTVGGAGVQLELSKIEAVDGEGLVLALGSNSLNTWSGEDQTVLRVSEEDFLSTHFGAGFGRPHDIYWSRGEAIQDLARAFEQDRNSAMLWTRLTPPQHPHPGTHGIETKTAKDCLKLLKLKVFDSITAWIGGELWEQSTEVIVNSNTLPGGALAATWPGMMWVLNPDTWDAMLPDEETAGRPPFAYRGAKKTAGAIAKALASPDRMTFGPDEKISWNDPLVSLAESPFMETEVGDPPYVEGEGLDVEPIQYFIQRMLTAQDLNRYKGHRIPTVYDFMVTAPLGPTEPDKPNPWDKIKRRRPKKFRFERGFYQLTRWKHPDLDKDAVGEMARSLLGMPYLDALLLLFNVGIFSLSDQIEELTEEDFGPYVEGFAETWDSDGTPTSIKLVYSAAPNSDIRLTKVQDIVEGGRTVTLSENICWQYVPAQSPITDPDLLAALQESRPDVLAAINAGHDQLIIVAGPGVSISYISDFPQTCEVELYRTLTTAQVPPLGAPINTQLLEAPYTISIYDDIRPCDGTANPPEADGFHGYNWVTPGTGYKAHDPFGEGGSDGLAAVDLSDIDSGTDGQGAWQPPGNNGDGIPPSWGSGTEYAYGIWPDDAPFPFGANENQGQGYEDIDGVLLERAPTLEDFRRRNAIRRDDAPFVAIKPFRDKGRDGVTGYDIVYKFQDSEAPSQPHENQTHRLWGGVKGDATVRVTHSKLSGRARFAFDLRYKIHHGVNRTSVSEALLQAFILGRMRDFVIGRDDLSLIQFCLIIHATPDVRIGIKDDNIADPIWESLWDHFQLEEVETTFDYHIFRTYDGVNVPTPDSSNVIHYGSDDFDFHAIAPLGESLPYSENDTFTSPRFAPASGNGSFVRSTVAIEQAQYEANVEMAQFLVDIGIGFIPFIGDVVDVEELLIAVFLGTDKWGRPVSNFEKIFMAGAVCLPFVSARVMRGVYRALPDLQAEDWMDDTVEFLEILGEEID